MGATRRQSPGWKRSESPIDVENLELLRGRWETVQDDLIRKVDADYGVYDGRKFNPRRWLTWVNEHHIPWPRKSPRCLDLSQKVFGKMARAYPEVQPMRELRGKLAHVQPVKLAVGADGRNRCPLRPFAAKTGRNAPSTTKFIFGPARWVRGLIKPTEGMALAYIDYEQQEFGIAAALSQDEAMLEAYRSGDPYLKFAIQAGAVPASATTKTHRNERARFKGCAIAVQYGQGAKSLAADMNVFQEQAEELLTLHKKTYLRYWRWSREVGRQAKRDGRFQTVFAWNLNVPKDTNPRSVRNFPLQANGAEILRLACCLLTEEGVRVCAPVHDALLVEAPAEDIDQTAQRCREVMEEVSEYVLKNLRLRTSAEVIRNPDCFHLEGRAQEMWCLALGQPVPPMKRTCNMGDTPVPYIQDTVQGGGFEGLVVDSFPVRGRLKSRDWVDGEFMKGPIPLSWWGKACSLPGGKALLTVASALWFLRGLRGTDENLKLTTAVLEKFSVDSRATKDRALKSLEKAGLVQVTRHRGRNPLVTMVLPS